MRSPQTEDVIRLSWLSENDNGFSENAIKNVCTLPNVAAVAGDGSVLVQYQKRYLKPPGEGVGKQSITFAARKCEAAAIFQKR